MCVRQSVVGHVDGHTLVVSMLICVSIQMRQTRKKKRSMSKTPKSATCGRGEMKPNEDGAYELKRSQCAILPLTLKKKWFDLIASGVKKEEYREIKPYWDTRIANWHLKMFGMGAAYSVIRFQLGYQKNAPFFYRMAMHCGNGDYRQHFKIRDDSIHPDWGEPKGEHYVFVLGAEAKILED